MVEGGHMKPLYISACPSTNSFKGTPYTFLKNMGLFLVDDYSPEPTI